MSRLSQMLLNEQAKRGLTDYKAAKEIGVLQQTYSSWKHGSVPRPNRYAAIAGWLHISIDMARELCEEAVASTGSTKLPRVAPVAEAGRVADRKEGKFKFDAASAGADGGSGSRIPSSRYTVSVDTKVMEPALLVGTKAWLDPSVWPKVGNEVMVHGKGGIAWLGRLESLSDGKAEISRYALGNRITIDDVQAVHAVVLSERVAGQELNS
ncbi:helix-turn-helix domain-containing protein [Sinorhizobium meliloti]|uniref:helix-turn-helix domain-containing protein n=1 Tax=Rhizobium meliloti TaxID=382 RepID=UPI00191466D0|nr:helix-turn-helix transcriptional regulator [Sinorhizobium meliloti]